MDLTGGATLARTPDDPTPAPPRAASSGPAGPAAGTRTAAGPRAAVGSPTAAGPRASVPEARRPSGAPGRGADPQDGRAAPARVPAPARSSRGESVRGGSVRGDAARAPGGDLAATDPGAGGDADGNAARPAVTELRLSAFGGRRADVHALGPVTLFAGPSGSGKSTTLRAYEALARLGAGEPLGEVFPHPGDHVPDRARPDAQGRRGFRIGCTVEGPAGPVHLDLAVQVEPRLRIVGERLSRHGRPLLTTALRDPGRSTVQAAWYTAGATPVTRAPLPDDLLGTALLPLRVAGKTPGQLEVLAAAEQLVIGLRSVFACEPRPDRMRAPVPPGDGRLRRGCGNLAEVLHRTSTACARRHQRFAATAGAGCAGPVTGLAVRELPDGTVRAVLERGGARPATPLGRLGDGELRYLALAVTLLTGPGVLAMDRIAEVPDAMQLLTLLADDLDRGLDGRQRRELLALTSSVAADGHIRVVGAVGEEAAREARSLPGVTVVDLEP
ncbi:ATP-binding protein [Streptomyces sp. NPDC003327]